MGHGHKRPRQRHVCPGIEGTPCGKSTAFTRLRHDGSKVVKADKYHDLCDECFTRATDIGLKRAAQLQLTQETTMAREPNRTMPPRPSPLFNPSQTAASGGAPQQTAMAPAPPPAAPAPVTPSQAAAPAPAAQQQATPQTAAPATPQTAAPATPQQQPAAAPVKATPQPTTGNGATAKPAPLQQQVQPQGRMVLPGQRRIADARPAGFRFFLWGEKKIGKTEFVVDAETVAFIPCETSPNVPADRCFEQPLAWAEIAVAIRAFLAGGHQFTGICIDTADAATALLHEHVKATAAEGAGSARGKIKYLSDVGGGFKGDERALSAMDEEWVVLLALLDRVRDRGYNVFLLGHSDKGLFRNPDGPDYDQWQPRLPNVIAGRIVGWADIVGFAKKDVTFEKAGGRGRAKAATTGAHMLYLQQERATFFAGNRFGLPAKMPLEYAVFAAAMQKRSTAEMTGMIEAIKERLAKLPPDHVVQSMKNGQAVEINVHEWVNAAITNNPNVGLLQKLDSRLQSIISELGLDEEPAAGEGEQQ